MKKGLKIALWIVGVVVAVVAIASVVAGPVAKGYVNRHGQQLCGRKVHVQHIGVNLFAGNATVRGLNVYEADGSSTFAGFDTLAVGVHLLRIPFHTLHIKHLRLSGFHASIEKEAEGFNFSSIIDHFAPDTTQPADTTPSQWTMRFYNIAITRGSVAYIDATNGKGWRLPDINLHIPGFVMGSEESSQGGLAVGFEQGGTLNVDANYDSKRNSFAVDLNIADFDVRNIESYIADALDYKRLGGKADVHISATGNVDELLRSRIAGTALLKGMGIEGRQGPLAQFDTLAVDITSINIQDAEYNIGSITLSGLKANYEQWDDHTNLSLLLHPSAQPTPVATVDTPLDTTPQQSAPTKPMRLHVGSISVNNAAITYANHTLPDDFVFPITGITVRVDDVTSFGDYHSGNKASVRASLPGGGHLALRWHGNINDWKQQQNIFLTVKGLDMRQLSPWAVAYTGQPIEEGVFGLTSRLDIRQSMLNNSNQIDIYKARVGSRRKGVDPEVKVPLKTALYVLKDKDDKILIDLPITGNVDSPEFNYMKLVWKTLGQLLVKVATSPARAIAGALGMNADDIAFMDADTLQRTLTSEQYHLLGNWATVLGTNDAVQLTITPHIDSTCADTVLQRYHFIGQQMLRYFYDQGIAEQRVAITDAQPAQNKRTGFAFDAQTIIDE